MPNAKKESKQPEATKAAPKKKAPKVEPMDKAKEKAERSIQLPYGCKLKEVEKDIKIYYCFEFEDAVYVVKDKVATQVSNFTCSIRMHIKGESPTRLIAIRNENKEEAVLHVAHDVFNTMASFRKTVTGEGNFQWYGNEADYMRYLWRMMDRMGKGRMILEPGMQPEGFFAFSNKVIHGPTVISLDEFGCFEVGKKTYYIPAANTQNGDESGYGNARKVTYVESDVTFEALARQQFIVHGNHGMLAMVHALGTLFSDYIRGRVNGFPVPFYYGPPGTGKDEVVKTNQHFWGKPQTAIRLPAANTAPAMVNVFAELRNNSLYGTEWASGLKDHVHTFCMGCWDGEGRKRGEKIQAGRSRYSTEDVPIRCTLSMSGNEYPNFMDQLLDRLVVSEMKRLDLSQEQRQKFRVLNDMNEKGFSHLLSGIVSHREEFVRTWFNVHYQKASEMANLAMADNFISERMRKNICILVATHLFFADKLVWPFSTDQLLAYLASSMVAQQKRRLSGDEVSNFWTCFVAGVNARQLLRDNQFELRDGEATVAFYWMDVFGIYMEHHRRIFGTPGKRDILNKLIQHDSFIPGKNKNTHDGYRIGERKSTAYVFDATQTGTNLIGLLSTDKQLADLF